MDKRERFQALAHRLGDTPSREFLENLKAQRLIFDYSIDIALGIIKVQPAQPVEWLEKKPGDSAWRWMTFK